MRRVVRSAATTMAVCLCLLTGGCSDPRIPQEQAAEPPVRDQPAERLPDRGEPISQDMATDALGDALQAVHDAQVAHPSAVATAADAQESKAVYDYLVKAQKLPAAAYWSAGRSITRLTLYEVLDEGEQDRIIKLLTDERTRRGWNPIAISFKKAEVLDHQPVEEGGLLSVRGDEEILREVLIDQ